MGGGEINYYTDEVCIGTWIDGKPLYQKTYSGTTPSTANINTNIVVDSIFTNINVVDFKGIVLFADAYVQINDDLVTNDHVRVWVSGDNSSIRCNVGSNAISKSIYITLQYTKTTD